eukprot:scaffold3420_cov115-Isochrysis_galbana.AAC.6
MRGNIALPPFWSQALDALHELPLTQTSLSRDGALSQPIWDYNRHYPPPKFPPRLRDRWESLQVTVVHNTFSDREGSSHFTKEENQSYIAFMNRLSLTLCLRACFLTQTFAARSCCRHCIYLVSCCPAALRATCLPALSEADSSPERMHPPVGAQRGQAAIWHTEPRSHATELAPCTHPA